MSERRFYVGVAAMVQTLGSRTDIDIRTSTVVAENEDIALGLFVKWAMEQRPGYAINTPRVFDVTEAAVAFVRDWATPQIVS